MLKNIYHDENLISRRANQFEVFDFPYSTDQEVVFYHEHLLEDADLKTFKVLTDGYAKDAKNVYYFENKIDADAKSFKVKRGKAKDKYHQYEYGKPIQE